MDVDLAQSLSSEIIDLICTPAEIEQISSEPDPGEAAMSTFVAKEAFYKAWYPSERRYLDMADVEISPPLPNSRQYQAAILPGRCEDPERAAAFIGRRLRLGPYLLAGMSKSRRP